MTDQSILAAIRAEFQQEPRLGAGFFPAELTLATDGTLTVAGEVDSVAAKKRALEIAGARPEVLAIVDRLRVSVAAPMTDAEILSHLEKFFQSEPSF